IRPFPAELRAETGIELLEPIIERGCDAWPAAQIFLMREADRVVFAIGFERPVIHPVAVLVQIREAPDVDDPEIHGRFTRSNPLPQTRAGAAAARDAEGIEAGTDIIVGELGRRTQDEIAVGREALRAMDHFLDAGGIERRNTRQGLCHMLLEMIPVVLEELE